MQEMQVTRVRSLLQEDPLEEGMAIHSSILAWRIPWTEEPGGLQSMGHKELDTTEVTACTLEKGFPNPATLTHSVFSTTFFVTP